MEGRCRFTFQPHWLLWAQECCCLCIPENNQNPDYSGLEHFRLRCREFTPLLSFRPESDRRRREDGVEETRGCLLHHAVTRCSHGIVESAPMHGNERSERTGMQLGNPYLIFETALSEQYCNWQLAISSW